jgi:ATP-binding cassette, subfamily F, member 3
LYYVSYLIFLLLDSQLDMESIQALSGALQNFTGGVLVISHDQYFIKQVCTQIWEVKDHMVTPFDGDIEQYKKVTLAKKIQRSKK